jgi:hypothetical protein
MRHELTGAYRSLRYDLVRRSDPAQERTDVLYPEYDAYEKEDRRQPRRLALAGGVGLVVAGGVAGTYFAVAGGLGALLAGTPATGNDSPPRPPAASPSAAGAQPATPTAQTTVLDGSPPAGPARGGAGATPANHVPAAVPTKRVPAPVNSTVIALPSCPCDAPLPTPNAPSPTPSDSPSPSPSPSVNDSQTPWAGHTHSDRPRH